MRNVYGSQERYETTYFKKFPGYYCTGDGNICYLKFKTILYRFKYSSNNNN